MRLETSMIGLAVFWAMAFFYWDKFIEQNAGERRRFLSWLIRGSLVPVVIWFFFNAGFFGLPPIMPDVEAARTAKGGKWFGVLAGVTANGIWIIGSYWCAVTLAWLAILISHRAERKPFLIVLAVCSLITLPLAGNYLFSKGLEFAGLAFVFWLLPVVHFTLPLLEKEIVLPTYSAAMAKLQMGKFDEAEVEVIKQLEMCEEDFDGWMMLATLYAEQHKDLRVAEKTIFELCAQTNVNSSQAAVALHRLADWHLKLNEDPVAAHRVLGEIGKRFPGSHVARMAELRLKQIPGSKEELIEQKVHRPLHLPAIGARLFEAAADEMPKPKVEEAAARANKLASKLKANPNDVTSREEFARILAVQLGKVDPAIEQIKLLLELPEQPSEKRAEWFGLLAAWELKYRHDAEAAQRFLHKVIQHYPQTPQAFAARKQLGLMEVEARLQKNRRIHLKENPRIQVG